jgi:hypothetical protein
MNQFQTRKHGWVWAERFIGIGAGLKLQCTYPYGVLTNYLLDLDSAGAPETRKNVSRGAERENCMRGVGREPRGRTDGWIMREAFLD